MNNKNEKVTTLIQKMDDNIRLNSKKPSHEHEILGLKIYDYVENAVLGAGLHVRLLADETPEGTLLLIQGNLPCLTSADVQSLINFHKNAATSYTVTESGSAAVIDAKFVAFTKEQDQILSIQEAGLEKQVYPDNGRGFVPVSTQKDIASAQKYISKGINEKWMDLGVAIVDPDVTYIGPHVKIGKDTAVFPNTFILGDTTIGEDCEIGHGSYLLDMEIGDGVIIQTSVMKKSKIGNKTVVGPFAYIRPGCEIGDNVKIGDFVEVKNSKIGNNTKASHLTYIGDSDLGEKINLGCGVVTVNYDGKNKARTVIEDNAFVGCNTNLIAPVTVEEGAYIAAGSTITKNVPKKNLGIARARQVNKEGWTLK